MPRYIVPFSSYTEVTVDTNETELESIATAARKMLAFFTDVHWDADLTSIEEEDGTPYTG